MDKRTFDLLLSQGEGFRLEYKEGISKDLSSEMVAFANSRGGKILIGVTGSGKVKGISNKNKVKSQIQDIARNCEPSIPVVLSEYKDVIITTIHEGKDKPYQCKSGFYRRIGPSSQKLKRDEIISFIHSEGYIHWETLPYTDFPSEQVYDKSLLKNYMEKTGLSSALPDSLTLCNLHCATPDEKGLQLTNAGYLFFGKLPKLAMTHTGITCALYKGTEKLNIIDRKDFQEDVISNIENAMTFLKRVINIRYELPYGELRRKNIPEIPYDALREAVINAVTHRDYANRGPCTTIEVFDDRVEISNPGGLPAPLKPEEFGKKSVPRNQMIAEMMLRLKYIEKMGTGIKRMQELCKKAGNPQPEFEFGGFFTVIFKKVITPETTQKSDEKTGERSKKKTTQSKLGDRLGKKLGKKLGDRLGKKLGEKLGKKLGDRLGKKLGEKLG